MVSALMFTTYLMRDGQGKGDREKGGGRKEKGVGERRERAGERRKRR